MTKYVILKEVDEVSGTCEPIGTHEGGSDEGAIRAYLATADNGEKYGEGNYRAVPERSWKLHSMTKKISFS